MSTTLAEMKAGDRFEIIEVGDPQVRAQLLRIGFLDGVVKCTNRIRNGPVVLEAGGTQIALGASVAADITIDPI